MVGFTLRWRLAPRPRLRFRVGQSMAFALPENDAPSPVAVVVGPAGQNARWLTGTLGDGVASEFIIDHGMDSEDVAVWLRFTAPPRLNIAADVEPVSADSVKISFLNPPAVDEFSFVLIGPP